MTALTSVDLRQSEATRPTGIQVMPVSEGQLRRLLALPRESLLRAATVAWDKPNAGSRLLGFGSALRLTGARGEPIERAASAVREAVAGASGPRVTGPARPRFFGGARFAPDSRVVDEAWDGFGGWQFVLPQLLVAERDGAVTGSFCSLDEEGVADPERAIETLLAGGNLDAPRQAGAATAPPAMLPRERWEAIVREAVAEIAAGRYEKAVLARMVPLEAGAEIDTGLVLSRLEGRYGNCFVFKFRVGEATWLGASPELLLSFRGGTLHTASLAGSRPRGADAADDARLAAELLASDKERMEHDFVARALREGLAPMCSGLSMPAEPRVASIANIHHLYTPMEATVRAGYDVFDLVAAVQPTPAVGGWPRDEALAAIDRVEGLDRGWYAGPIGWVDFTGHGEFAVGLRSALVSGATARLYAGAGIVAASESAEEYLETETKLRPLREALAD